MRYGLLLVLALLDAVPLSAQHPGVVELGVFARYTRFDDATGPFRPRAGVGARLGVTVWRDLAIEGEASYTTTRSQGQDLIRYVPLHARVVYHVPLSVGYGLLLGGGYTRTLFREAYRETSDGVGALAGFRIGTGTVTIRLEGTADYVTNPETATGPGSVAGITRDDRNWHLGAQAGLSFLLGRGRAGRRDRDQDGVADPFDLCPGSPSGSRVDRSGCPVHSPPRDADGDGVTDQGDRCPGTPIGVEVDSSGCPLDRDGDGVADHEDRCPGTPAGTRVDSGGCPLDADGDGVTDERDRCPGTAAGARVDEAGCQLFLEERASLSLEGVHFDLNRAVLRAESRSVLARVAESLLVYPEVTVEIGGHTDATGSLAYNLWLSRQRAERVKAFLVSRGVDPRRMAVRGYGPARPIASNATAAGRAQNRRVEFRRTD